MMTLHTLVCYVLILVTSTMLLVTADIRADPTSNYKLKRAGSYMIVAPNKIYPGEIVQVAITLFRLDQPQLWVKTSIKMNGELYAWDNALFTEASSRTVQMEMPDNSQPGNYTFRVEGGVDLSGGGNLFENETDIMFDVKQVSVFIQTDKPVYKQGQVVNFRIIPMKPNMLMTSGSMDVFCKDPSGNVVKRWFSVQTNAGGIVDMKVQLSEQPKYGEWSIMVSGWGDFYNGNFYVEEFYLPRFFVNVSAPAYIMEDTFALAGVITANHTSGRPVRGNGTIRMEIRDPPGLASYNPGGPWPTIVQDIFFFTGRIDYMFTLQEVRDAVGQDISGKELYVSAEIQDWYLQKNESGYSICVIYGHEVSMVLLGDQSRSFKPGFPATVYWALVNADGTPLSGNRRQVTINVAQSKESGRLTSTEIKRIVPDDGIVQYEFLTEPDDKYYTIRAFYDLGGASVSDEVVFWRVFSTNNEYLSLSTSTRSPVVNEYMVFTVRTTSRVDTVYYIIVATGNIIAHSQLEMHSRQKTFSVALSRDMVPSAHIIAYYLLDGQIVADSLNFFVNGSGLNQVNVDINMGKDFSKHTVEMIGRTDPVAYMAFAGLDYDLYKYGEINFITEDQVIDELLSYDSHINSSFYHTWFNGENEYNKVFFPSSGFAIDANTTFTFTGLLVFTDANLTRIIHDCNETRGYLPCNDGNCYEVEQRCDNVRQCKDGTDEMGCPKVTTDIHTPLMKRLKHLPRHFEQMTDWMWREHFTKPNGRINLRVDVPKEPMTWVVGGFAMSTTNGFGLAKSPARFDSTRPFYIQVEMPEKAYKGEQIGVRVALFNYWLVDMECLVMLHDSSDYVHIVVDDFGVVNSYNPKTARGDIQTMVYLRQGQMSTIYLPVVPMRDDSINVTVSAISFMGKDTVSKSLYITYDGVTNYYTTPYLLDLVNQGSLTIPDFEIPVPDRFILSELQRQHLYVPGSQKAFVGIIGDTVGPMFFEPFLDAEIMMRRPYGCGEQATYNFAVNLIYLKYLQTTNQLEDKTMRDALDYMNVALQRILSYMNNTDGSFTMFRDYRKPMPSTWLTAYVLQSLSASNEANWIQYFYMSTDLLNRIAVWLSEQQDRNTGAFFERGAPAYDTKMNAREVYDEDSGQMKNETLTLTAYVLIALTEATGVNGKARVQVDQAAQMAQSYLERFVQRLEGSFETAIVTYALTKSGSKIKTDALKKLDALKRTTEFVYWSDVEIPSNPTRIINTVPFQYPRKIYPTEAAAVEATSYALLSYLQLGLRNQGGMQIMKWIQSMWNSIGGFGATRDSIVALSALTEFAAGDTDRSLYNVEIKVEFTSSSGGHLVRLNSTNWYNLQKIEVPKVFGQVKTQVKGTGMAQIGVYTQVNVEYGFLQRPLANGTFFNLTMERLYFYGRNFSVMEMTTCAKWIRPDLRPRTGMVVIEIDLPTGYVVMNNELREYVRSGAVPNLGRAEWFNNRVIFYLDYLDQVKTCVDFRADRWFPVANATIQHLVKIYDYYEPGMYNHTLYTTYNLFNLHICQVCGSFQCPYCPFYNSASSLIPTSIILTIMATLAMIIASRLKCA